MKYASMNATFVLSKLNKNFKCVMTDLKHVRISAFVPLVLVRDGIA